MKKFDKITVCLDMAGCPNRCRHCWIGAGKNGGMEPEELTKTEELFREFGRELEIISWYREPDFREDYRRLWEMECALSTVQRQHFELASFWRLVREEAYASWLWDLGVRTCQLTLFGGEETTDYYVGRKGAFREIQKAVDILLEHGIAPRMQVFVNRQNLPELEYLEKLFEEWGLKERCALLGQRFETFVHQGSCDGENEKLYDIRITQEDLKEIPAYFVNNTLAYMQAESLSDVFGSTEEEWYLKLREDSSCRSIVNGSPVFYVDSNFDVYPNESSPFPWWRLGNLKKDSTEEILQCYVQNRSVAQRMMALEPISQLVRGYGDWRSSRLFTKEDWLNYLLNRKGRTNLLDKTK